MDFLLSVKFLVIYPIILVSNRLFLKPNAGQMMNTTITIEKKELKNFRNLQKQSFLLSLTFNSFFFKDVCFIWSACSVNRIMELWLCILFSDSPTIEMSIQPISNMNCLLSTVTFKPMIQSKFLLSRLFSYGNYFLLGIYN